MKNQSKKATALSKMCCSMFGHQYVVTKHVTKHVKEYTCCRCKKQLTTSSNGNLVELTPKFKEINSILEHVYQNKMNRSKKKPFASSIC